jgi:N-acetylmuramoyl-L-alanine amidase
MKLKTATFCCFALTFSLATALANIEGETWVFHHNNQLFTFRRGAELKGTPTVSLFELSRAFKLLTSYDPKQFRVTMIEPNSKRQISFYTYSRELEGKLAKAPLSSVPFYSGTDFQVPIDFGDRVLRPLLTGDSGPDVELASRCDADVVIDPGHGGNDWGASSQPGLADPVKEKDMTLAFSKRLKKSFEDRKFKVRLTRSNDAFLSLPERSQIANHCKAKLFLSIHLNSHERNSGRGFEIYVLSLKSGESEGRATIARENQMIPKDLPLGADRALSDLRAEANLESSLKFAKAASDALTQFAPAFGKPIKMGPFYVLYGAEMPSILIELGFITNTSDRLQLNTDKIAEDLARKLVANLAESLKKGITLSQ